MKKENKKFVTELKRDELETLFDNIKTLREKYAEIAYSNNMDYQTELAEILLGKNWHKYIELKDHYCSFYLRLINVREFFENLSLNNSDYLEPKQAEKYIELYKKAKKLNNNIKKCSYASDNMYKNENELENICIELLEILENELHTLENITEEDELETFIDDVGNNAFDGVYILNNDFTKIYEHIDYIKVTE